MKIIDFILNKVGIQIYKFVLIIGHRSILNTYEVVGKIRPSSHWANKPFHSYQFFNCFIILTRDLLKSKLNAYCDEHLVFEVLSYYTLMLMNLLFFFLLFHYWLHFQCFFILVGTICFKIKLVFSHLFEIFILFLNFNILFLRKLIKIEFIFKINVFRN